MSLALPSPMSIPPAGGAGWAGVRRRRRGVALVLAAHVAALIALWSARSHLPPLPLPPILQVNLVMAEARAPESPRPLPSPTRLPTPAVVVVPVPQIQLATPDPAPVPAAVPVPVPVVPVKPIQPLVVAAAVVPAPPPPPPPAPPAPRTLPSSAVAYLQPPPIELPLASRRLGEQGTVWLRVRVGTDGLPREVTLHRSSGHARLDEQALWAMKRARFRPQAENGQPIEWIVIAPLQYEIE